MRAALEVGNAEVENVIERIKVVSRTTSSDGVLENNETTDLTAEAVIVVEGLLTELGVALPGLTTSLAGALENVEIVDLAAEAVVVAAGFTVVEPGTTSFDGVLANVEATDFTEEPVIIVEGFTVELSCVLLDGDTASEALADFDEEDAELGKAELALTTGGSCSKAMLLQDPLWSV